MLPLLEPFGLRWLEEPVIPDDIHGYAALKALGRIPIAGGEHEHTTYGFRQLLEARAVDYIQFDTNRVGGITQAQKIQALAESFAVPVVPHAGQMHNFHVVMASFNSPMAEFFPIVDVEIGNELFWYIFDGEVIAELAKCAAVMDVHPLAVLSPGFDRAVLQAQRFIRDNQLGIEFGRPRAR